MAEQLDYLDPLVRQDLLDFGNRTFKRIQRNFKTLGISPYNNNSLQGWLKTDKLKGKKMRSTGSLYRSIFWKVYNEAGGDMMKVTFFFKHYAVFVETGTGAGVKWSPLPELVELSTLKRSNTKRVAKPFLMSEIRLHARITLEQLAENFAYTGGLYILSSVMSHPENADRGEIEKIYLNGR